MYQRFTVKQYCKGDQTKLKRKKGDKFVKSCIFTSLCTHKWVTGKKMLTRSHSLDPENKSFV